MIGRRQIVTNSCKACCMACSRSHFVNAARSSGLKSSIVLLFVTVCNLQHLHGRWHRSAPERWYFLCHAVASLFLLSTLSSVPRTHFPQTAKYIFLMLEFVLVLLLSIVTTIGIVVEYFYLASLQASHSFSTTGTTVGKNFQFPMTAPISHMETRRSKQIESVRKDIEWCGRFYIFMCFLLLFY